MASLKSLPLFMLIAISCFTLSGCGTVEGFGKDLQKVGEHIEEDADKDGD